MLLWFADVMNVTEEVTIHRPYLGMNILHVKSIKLTRALCIRHSF